MKTKIIAAILAAVTAFAAFAGEGDCTTAAPCQLAADPPAVKQKIALTALSAQTDKYFLPGVTQHRWSRFIMACLTTTDCRAAWRAAVETGVGPWQKAEGDTWDKSMVAAVADTMALESTEMLPFRMTAKQLKDMPIIAVNLRQAARVGHMVAWCVQSSECKNKLRVDITTNGVLWSDAAVSLLQAIDDPDMIAAQVAWAEEMQAAWAK